MAFLKRKKNLVTLLIYIAVVFIIIIMMSPAISCKVLDFGKNNMAANANYKDLSQASKLLVGSDTSYPPFEYLNDQGNAEGFDIEIIKEIGQRLSKEVEIKPVPYDSLYKEITEGNIDLIISALTVLEDKKAVVDYSQPYYTMEYLLISLRGTEIKLKEDLDGQKVGLLKIDKGSLAEDIISRYRATEYDDIKVMIEDLKTKKIEGLIIAKPIAINILSQDGKMYTVLDTLESNREFVIAISKNSGIKEDIDSIIAQMSQDGTLTEIYNRWFSLD